MAYGTPVTGEGVSVWALSVEDTTAPAYEGGYVSLSFASPPFGHPPADLAGAEALFQKIVTLIEGHADLQITNAQRDYPSTQFVTP